MTDGKTREAIRYLGYGRNAVDERTSRMIEESFKELEGCANAKSVYRIFECTMDAEESLLIGNVRVHSKNLYKNLKNCREVILFAATLGIETDRLLKRYSISDMSRAVVLQACAAAYLEEYCDNCQNELEDSLQGRWLRPRFSPGYGDFDIRHQEDILKMLDAMKRIGIGRTESYMLTPTKSVTAVIGISQTKENCHKQGCEVCDKKDCAYRRD